MVLMKRGSIVMFSLLLAMACGAPASRPLTLVHLNDTHSHLEAVPVTLKVEGVDTTVELGGFARLQTEVDRLRREHPGLLMLHAGDAVQGTLYFGLFHGEVDFEALNRLGVEAMTFGNHEFDRGPKAIPGFLNRAKFPLVSCNIDFSGEPALASRVKPYVIREVDGFKVGIIGATTEETPIATADVGRTKFNDATSSVAKAAAELEALGVNRIILLSHLGYPLDKALASKVSGVDIIVGGHSHTLLGDEGRLGSLGLKPQGPYPTVVNSSSGAKVLVVQAWQWGEMLGTLQVRFSKGGLVESFESAPRLIAGDRFKQEDKDVSAEASRRIRKILEDTGLVRFPGEDPGILSYLEPFQEKVNAHRQTVLARATQDLNRSLNGGPGPLIADSMLQALPRAQAAILNYGGVRRDLRAGDISQADVMEVLPFGNGLCLLELSGAELRRALEEDIEFLVRKFEGVDPLPMPYLAGLKLDVDLRGGQGNRVKELQILRGERFEPVEAAAKYWVAVNSFEAGGGDGFETLKAASVRRIDTGIIDVEAFTAFLLSKGEVADPVEARVRVVK